MRDLLTHSKTKWSILELLLSPTVKYVVAANHRTYHSENGEYSNNHKEAGTQIICCFSILEIQSSSILDYAIDTDIFASLVVSLADA